MILQTSQDKNALYRSQSGDLNTPGMGIMTALGRPLSMEGSQEHKSRGVQRQ